MTGPQSSYNAVETLLLTCEDMLKEYEHLAQSGSAILSKVDGAIGLCRARSTAGPERRSPPRSMLWPPRRGRGWVRAPR